MNLSPIHLPPFTRTLLLFLMVLFVTGTAGCANKNIFPVTSSIDRKRIEPVRIEGIIHVVNKTKKKSIKNGAPFSTYYHVDTLQLSKEYIGALKKEIAHQAFKTGNKTDKYIGVELYELNYLGAVSLSFNASAWIKLKLKLGDSEEIFLNVKYTTPRSLSLKESFMLEAFGGVISEAVVMTLNHEEVRQYLSAR